MQRQLYLALLLVTMALAAAVCLRPSLGEDLIRLTGLRGGSGSQDNGASGLPAGVNAYPVGTFSPLESRAAVGQSVPWPATPAGEAFASDGQDPAPSSPSRYRVTAQEQSPSWAATPRWPPAPPSRPEAQRPPDFWGGAASTQVPPGPSYPVAGAGRSGPGAPPSGPRFGDPGAGESPSDPVPFSRVPMGGPSSPLGRTSGPVVPGIAEAKPCEGTEAMARVGNEMILAGEVMPAYNQIMGGIPESELAALSRERLELERKALLSRLLEGHVQTKLVYLDAKRTIPEERFPEIERKVTDHFEKEELPKRIEKAGVATAAEYEEKLRAIGSSLERMKRSFVQQALAKSWLDERRRDEPKISHGEMIDYYHEHRADYETPARARWEMMTVRIPRYSDGQEARARLAQMGNQLMQGRSMAEVLAAQPKDGLECRGGVQGWVAQGDTEVSDTIEQGIFSLPVGQPSRIFRDGDAFHIIRVLQREPFQRTPFEDPEVQSEIREKLREQLRNEQTEKYLARLRQQFPVWTVFDDDPELAELRRQSDASRN